MKSLQNSSARIDEPASWAPVSGLEPERLGDELKTMFHSMASAPLPARMLELALALEEAFHRGELHGGAGQRLS